MKKLILFLLLVPILATAQVQYGTPKATIITGQATQTASGNNIILATAGTGSTDVTAFRSVAIQIIPTGTVSSGVVTFEGSNDNTTFVAIPLYDEASLTANPVSTVSPATGVSRYFLGPLYWRYFRARISTVIGGGGSLQAITSLTSAPYQPDVYTVTQATGANLNVAIASGTVTNLSNITNSVTPGVTTGNLGKAEDAVAATTDTGVAIWYLRNDALTSNTNASGDYIAPVTDLYGATLVKDEQRHKRTYRTAFIVTPAATASDVFQIIGSATTSVEITKIIISGTITTAGEVDVYVIKRSTANTSGTSSASTMVPLISSDAAATAVGAIYTANPTTGTPVGSVWIGAVPFGATTGAVSPTVIDFGERGKPLTLSGVAQALAINLNGATTTGLALKIVVEFTEL